ncbi:MAG TPA: hypothetical protein DDY78_06060 [Planctomycetales bacterium]|nr:hypothetical protein [Planctomycetales bacterium]
MRRHGKEILPTALLSKCRRWPRAIRDQLLRFVGLGVSVGRSVARRPSVKLTLEALEPICLPNNLLALLPLGALLPDFTSAAIALLPAATDRVFDEPTGTSAGLSGLAPTAQVVSARPLAIAQSDPTVIAPTTTPAASPTPADLAFQSGFPDQAVGMFSSAAFSDLLDAASAFPARPTASPASPAPTRQPAGAAAASPAAPISSSAAPVSSSAAPVSSSAAPASSSAAPISSSAAPAPLPTAAPRSAAAAPHGGAAKFAASAPSPQGPSISPTIYLISSPNPSVQYQTVTLTASVGFPGGPLMMGSVTFTDGATQLGTQPITQQGPGSGSASINTSFSTVGSHTILAVYSGDANYNSVSSTVTQTVNPGQPQSATTTTLTTSGSPSAPGYPVTFTAYVAGQNGGAPTGTVTFKNGATTLGTGTLVQGSSVSTATFTTSSLSLGDHTITATYSGDPAFTASASAALTQTVENEPTTTTLTSNINPSVPGQGVTFTANVFSASSATRRQGP